MKRFISEGGLWPINRTVWDYHAGELFNTAVESAALAEGLTWQQARRHVMDAAPHYVAQYSPITMGFQVIGCPGG